MVKTLGLTALELSVYFCKQTFFGNYFILGATIVTKSKIRFQHFASLLLEDNFK